MVVFENTGDYWLLHSDFKGRKWACNLYERGTVSSRSMKWYLFWCDNTQITLVHNAKDGN